MTSPDTANDSEARSEDNGKTTVVDSAVQHATDLAATLVWDGEHSYLVATENGHVRTFAVRSSAFERWLISKMRGHGTKWPNNPSQWTAIRDNLDSLAEEGGVQRTPSIRVAGRAARYAEDGTTVIERATVFIDLGDDKWNCIKATADGWTVEPHPADGPYFYRPGRMAPLPVPKPGGKLADLHRVLNAVDPDEQMLLSAWIVQALWPKGPYPLLPVHGAHGSAKTTRVSAIKALTDPTLSDEETPAVTSPRKPPRDERSLISAARNNRVLAYDNVSYLDDWLMDAYCRLATGAELGDRELYSDFEEAVFSACRPIMLNGIPDVIGQSDLADRCVQSEATKPVHRKSEDEYWDDFRKHWPQLFGVVLDLLVLALRHWGHAKQHVHADVRMKAYAQIGEAIGIGLKWTPGAFTTAYAANLRDAATEIARNDVLYAPLIDLLEESGGSWMGTHKELHAVLNSMLGLASEERKLKEWPKSPKALSNKLTRLTPAFAFDGIVIQPQERSHGITTRTIERIFDDS